MVLLARTLALLAMTMATTAIKVVPLDMAENSFDDQYWGCGRNMTTALPSLLKFELQKNPLFAQTWLKAEAEWRKQGSRVSSLLSAPQAVALMAYKYLYNEFNAAVRVAGHSRQVYRNNFHFKTLHFLLTQTLVKLRHAQNGRCHDVFQGMRNVHFKARRGQTVRFGQFILTSPSRMFAQHYGADTLFEIRTCHGVGIQGIISYDPSNQEVLIPPYETFVVTNVIRNQRKTWITLHSTGTDSKHNCALL